MRNVLMWSQLGTGGDGFYIAANEIAADMAHRHGMTLPQVAGIIAALSPQTPWDRNIKLAEIFCKTGKLNGVPRSRVHKCVDISGITCPNEIARLVFGTAGHKIESFYWNILGDSHAVTIDSHALFSLFRSPEDGMPNGGFHTPFEGRSPRGPQYDFLAKVYKDCSNKLNVSPSELQARVWANVRNFKNLREHSVEVPF